MSLGIYCIMCGTKHEYTLAKPKFCQNCGQSLDGKAFTAERKVIVVDSEVEQPKPLSYSEKLRQRLLARQTQTVEDEDLIEDEIILPDPGKLNFKVEGGVKKECLRDLAVGAAVEKDISRREPGPLKLKNQKQFERDFKKLAGKTRE